MIALSYLKSFKEFDKNLINIIADDLVGVKRSSGQHSGGLIIVPKDRSVYEFTPLQYPANKETTVPTTHFAFDYLHDNLVKMDALGHDTPTILKYLEELTGISQDNVDFTDRNVFGIFQGYENLGIDPKWFPINKATAGIPEFNTPFLKQMLDEVEPKTFSELNRICGASHGTDVWMGNIRDVVLSGTATLSEVPCTRDDIMNYLISKGVDNKIAFNIMERVRKGKELTNELLKVLKDNNIPEWYVNILKKIKYLFPKSHATAYLITAFKIAWYKYYYPLEFYAVTFSVRPEEFKIEYAFEDPKVIKEEIFKLSSNYGLEKKEKDKLMILELILEMRLRGYTFKNVDINKSHYSRFLPVDNQLLIPLDKIDGLGDIAAKKIWEFRKTKKIEFEEELGKLVNKTVLEKLKNNGVNLKRIEDTKNKLFN